MSTTLRRAPPAGRQAVSVTPISALAFVLVLSSWAAILVWSASPYARYLDHAYQPSSASDYVASLMLFATAWTLMIVAMMLPTAASLFRRFDRLAARRRDRLSLLVLLTTGFVLSWLLVGYLFRIGDSAVHGIVASIGLLEERPELIGGLVLVSAGLYQFTPLKYRCLTACRSPQSFVYRYWRDDRARANAFRIGAAYGVSCIGCCWTLMLVLFALGAGNVLWMLGVATVMTIEKTARFGASLVKPAGLVLIALGIAMVAAGQ